MGGGRLWRKDRERVQVRSVSVWTPGLECTPCLDRLFPQSLPRLLPLLLRANWAWPTWTDFRAGGAWRSKAARQLSGPSLENHSEPFPQVGNGEGWGMRTASRASPLAGWEGRGLQGSGSGVFMSGPCAVPKWNGTLACPVRTLNQGRKPASPPRGALGHWWG